jgi:hypothetical protein
MSSPIFMLHRVGEAILAEILSLSVGGVTGATAVAGRAGRGSREGLEGWTPFQTGAQSKGA